MALHLLVSVARYKDCRQSWFYGAFRSKADAKAKIEYVIGQDVERYHHSLENPDYESCDCCSDDGSHDSYMCCDEVRTESDFSVMRVQVGKGEFMALAEQPIVCEDECSELTKVFMLTAKIGCGNFFFCGVFSDSASGQSHMRLLQQQQCKLPDSSFFLNEVTVDQFQWGWLPYEKTCILCKQRTEEFLRKRQVDAEIAREAEVSRQQEIRLAQERREAHAKAMFKIVQIGRASCRERV
jgi:hypothetical protein